MRNAMLWSIRRELWENRSIYVAPLGAAIVYGLSDKLAIVVAVLVAIFYCLDALHGERRDRSILFWKSLPVSDTVTVLAKLAVPMIVVPVTVFVAVIAVHVLRLIVDVSAVTIGGATVGSLARHWQLFHMELVLLYSLAVSALWLAPMFAWLLLVSAWAKRATFLSAVLLPVGLCILERITFGSYTVLNLLKHRLTGCLDEAFTASVVDERLVEQLDPLRFLSSPGLWLGLLAAAALIAATIRLRRSAGIA